MDDLSKDGLFCLCQHFAIWYEALKEERPADFGEPCARCRKIEKCRTDGFPWLAKILPILDSQRIEINLVHQKRP